MLRRLLRCRHGRRVGGPPQVRATLVRGGSQRRGVALFVTGREQTLSAGGVPGLTRSIVTALRGKTANSAAGGLAASDKVGYNI